MDMRSLQGSGQSATSTPRAPTLNDRLNRALDRIETEADRIERCLGRINGTPIKEGAMVGGTAQVVPTRNMVAIVEAFEQQAERLRHLSEHVDQVA